MRQAVIIFLVRFQLRGAQEVAGQLGGLEGGKAAVLERGVNIRVPQAKVGRSDCEETSAATAKLGLQERHDENLAAQKRKVTHSEK